MKYVLLLIPVVSAVVISCISLAEGRKEKLDIDQAQKKLNDLLIKNKNRFAKNK